MPRQIKKKEEAKKVTLLLLDQIMPSLSSSEPSGSNGPNTLTSLYFTCPPFVSSHLMFLLSWIEAGVRQALMKAGCCSDDQPREDFSPARGLPVLCSLPSVPCFSTLMCRLTISELTFRRVIAFL